MECLPDAGIPGRPVTYRERVMIFANRLFSVFALMAALCAGEAAAQSVVIALDEAKVLNFKENAASVIVGNPAVADITVQNETTALLFGKAPGSTNILVLDEAGNEIQNLRISVSNPSSGVLVVQRGIRTATYTCLTRCTPTPAIGDDPEAFDSTSAQVAARVGALTSASQAASGDSDEEF